MRIKGLFLAFILFSIGIVPNYASTQRHHQIEEFKEERPKPTILLNRNIYNPPAVCKEEDFKRSCGTNQRCKERKEACGDKASEEFTDSLLAVQTRLGQVAIHDGKYSGNRGIDDLRSVQTHSRSYVISTENKADSSKLNTKTNQHSTSWNRNIISKLSTKKKITPQQHDQFKADIQDGRMVRGYSHVALKADNDNVPVFQQSYGAIFSSNGDLRVKEEQSYCRTIHPQVMVEAAKPGAKATPALISLNATCQYYASQTPQQPANMNYSSVQKPQNISLTRQTPSIISSEFYEYDEQVCYYVPYSQQSLRNFMTYLVDKGHSKTSVARNTKVTEAVITSVIANPNYKPTKYSLTDIWDLIQQKYQEEFNIWAARLYRH